MPWAAGKANECGVPDDLIGQMITTPPSTMEWLTVDDLKAMG